jgi:hypothetical protein
MTELGGDVTEADTEPEPEKDQGAERIEQADSEQERLKIEAELIEQTDNRPRKEDGEQPAE